MVHTVCVVQALESIIKTSKAVDKVKQTAFEDLPSVRKVHSHIKQDDNTSPIRGLTCLAVLKQWFSFQIITKNMLTQSSHA